MTTDTSPPAMSRDAAGWLFTAGMVFGAVVMLAGLVARAVLTTPEQEVTSTAIDYHTFTQLTAVYILLLFGLQAAIR